ncbi:hypothetical protein D046_0292B, partial [Vibrio parahaemolyticus V-223/04]
LLIWLVETTAERICAMHFE